MQSKKESAIEATLNIGSGFILSLVVWQILAHLYAIPMPITRNLEITSIFTAVSLTRSYVWRRIFNWKAIRRQHETESIHNGREHAGAKAGREPAVLCDCDRDSRLSSKGGTVLREEVQGVPELATGVAGCGSEPRARINRHNGGA